MRLPRTKGNCNTPLESTVRSGDGMMDNPRPKGAVFGL